MTKKQVLILIGIGLVILAIPLTMYLVRQTQIFKPKAVFIPKVEFVDDTGALITETTDPNVKLKITKEAASSPTPSASPEVTPSPTPATQAFCADGTDDQVYSTSMVGCNGSVSFDNAPGLCASLSHVCSITEYFAQGGQSTPPTGFRWLSTKSGDAVNCGTTICAGDFCTLFNQPPGNTLGLMSAEALNTYANSCSERSIDNAGLFSSANLTSNRGAVCCKEQLIEQ